MKKVTVLMPVYNVEKYIEKSIDSILNQTYKNFELIIIDDGSTDKTIEKICKYKDERIILKRNETNKGLPYTRNLGLSMATGEYIAFLDGDDIAHEKRLELQIDLLENNNQIDLVGSNYIAFDDFGKKYKSNLMINPEEIRANFMFRNSLQNSAVTLRRNIVENKKLKYNEKYFTCQDYGFWAEYGNKSNMYNVKEPLLYYREGHDSVTSKSKANRIEERKNILFDIKKKVIFDNGFELYDDEIRIINEVNYDGDSNVDTNMLKRYYDICLKMKKQNKSRKLFNNRDFKYILQNNWEVAIIKKCSSKTEILKLLLFYRFSNDIRLINNNLNRLKNIIK